MKLLDILKRVLSNKLKTHFRYYKSTFNIIVKKKKKKKKGIFPPDGSMNPWKASYL